MFEGSEELESTENYQLLLQVFSTNTLRASLSKIDGKDVYVKFCFCKIHVSLVFGVKTKPNPPIQMGGHAPGGHIA